MKKEFIFLVLLLLIITCSSCDFHARNSEADIEKPPEDILYLLTFTSAINNKMGYMDKEGNIIIPPQYDTASSFSYNKAAVSIDNKFGYIDESGNIVIPLIYDRAYTVYDGLMCVYIFNDDANKYSTCLYLDETGEVILELNYFRCGLFSEGLAPVAKHENSKFGAIDITGNFVIEPQYTLLGNFNEGLAAFSLSSAGRKFGFINKENEIVIPDIYDSVKFFYDGLAPVELDGKWGYIDKENNVVIPFIFDFANQFVEGMATVKEGEYWGVIDRNGEYIISPQYEYFLISECINGVIAVYGNIYTTFYIDLQGKVIHPKE